MILTIFIHFFILEKLNLTICLIIQKPLFLLSLKLPSNKTTILNQYTKLLIQIIVYNKQKVSNKLLTIAHSEIETDIWQKYGKSAKDALLYYITLEKVRTASKLCNIFVMCDFELDAEKDKANISPTSNLLVKTSQYLMGLIEIEQLLEILDQCNVQDESAYEYAIEMLTDNPDLYQSTDDNSVSKKLSNLKTHCFEILGKTENSNRKKSVLTTLLYLSFFQETVGEICQFLSTIMDKLNQEKDEMILDHLGEVISKMIQKVEKEHGLKFSVDSNLDSDLGDNIFKKIKEICFGKSKIQDQQAAILLSYHENLPSILSPDQAISLYNKYLYQVGYLEDISIKALSNYHKKTENVQTFEDKLVISIKLLTLPKNVGQANIVLFLRDLIEICESFGRQSDFFKFVEIAGRSKDKENQTLVDNPPIITDSESDLNFLAEIVLLSLDSTSFISSRAKKILKTCSNSTNIKKAVGQRSFLDSAINKLYSPNPRARYYSIEGIALHLEKISNQALSDNKFVFDTNHNSNFIEIEMVPILWEKLLYVSDDIQDKPKLAAIKQCSDSSFLDKITQKLANESILNHYNQAEVCQTTLTTIIDKLIKTIEITKSNLTRNLSINVINSIAKKCKNALRPSKNNGYNHAIKLVKLFIEAASGLESEKIQQISAQVEMYGNESLKNQLHELKISTFFESNAYESMIICIEVCDDITSMIEINKELISIMKSGIGSTTKCIAIHSVIDVVKVIEANFEKFQQQWKDSKDQEKQFILDQASSTTKVDDTTSSKKVKSPKKSKKSKSSDEMPYFNGKFMAALFSCLNDNNEAIYRRAISSIVYLLKSKATKKSTVDNVCNRIVTEYFAAKNNINHSNQLQLAKLCLALPQNILTGKPLGLSFLAKHQYIKDDVIGDELAGMQNLIKIWTKVFEENTASKLTAIRTNLNEIIELCGEALEQQCWTTKACGAKTLHSLIEELSVDSCNDIFTEEVEEKIENLLVKSIKTIFWDGKRFACAALLELCVYHQNHNKNDKNNEKIEKHLRTILSQLKSQTADSTHLKAISSLTIGLILPKFYSNFSNELKKDFRSWIVNHEDLKEVIERY